MPQRYVSDDSNAGHKEIIGESKKDTIIQFLKKLNFVKWDRYSGEGENLIFYGWINRDKDSYKDFLCIEFNEGKVIVHETSSEKYSKKIAEILGRGHSDCKRVEDFCNISNMIKLVKKPKNRKKGGGWYEILNMLSGLSSKESKELNKFLEKRKLSDEQIKEIILKKNKSLSKLAKEFNVSPMAIYYHLHPKFKVRNREYHKKWYSKLTKEKKKELLDKGREYQKIYHSKRYKEDPYFREKQLKRMRKK